jgi:hypothetical protein
MQRQYYPPVIRWDALLEMLIALFGMSMPPSMVLAELLFVASPYERPLAFRKAAHGETQLPYPSSAPSP